MLIISSYVTRVIFNFVILHIYVSFINFIASPMFWWFHAVHKKNLLKPQAISLAALMFPFSKFERPYLMPEFYQYYL
jgi:hypothetical protein